MTEEDWADCSSYLRISCREALISLPRSHSTGLGLSHLQCKAERMGRSRGGREGGERRGKHCINACARSLSLSLSLSLSPHRRTHTHTQTYKHTHRHTSTQTLKQNNWQTQSTHTDLGMTHQNMRDSADPRWAVEPEPVLVRQEMNTPEEALLTVVSRRSRAMSQNV